MVVAVHQHFGGDDKGARGLGRARAIFDYFKDDVASANLDALGVSMPAPFVFPTPETIKNQTQAYYTKNTNPTLMEKYSAVVDDTKKLLRAVLPFVAIGSFQFLGSTTAATLGSKTLHEKLVGLRFFHIFEIKQGISCMFVPAGHIHGSLMSLLIDETGQGPGQPPVVRLHTGDCKADAGMLEGLCRGMSMIRAVHTDIQVVSATVDETSISSATPLAREESVLAAVEGVRGALQRHGKDETAVVYYCYKAGSRPGKLGLALVELMGGKLYQERAPHHVSQAVAASGNAELGGKAELLSNTMSECRVFQCMPPNKHCKLGAMLQKVAAAVPRVKHIVVVSSAGWGRVRHHVFGSVPGDSSVTFRIMPMAYSDHSTRLECGRLMRMLRGYGLECEGLVALTGRSHGGPSDDSVRVLWGTADDPDPATAGVATV